MVAGGGHAAQRASGRAAWLRGRAGLVLAALRWRRASSFAVLLAAVTAFAGAGLGPLWATASQDALGSARLRQAPAVDRQVVVDKLANRIGAGEIRSPEMARRDVTGIVERVDGAAAGALGPSRVALSTAGRLRLATDSAKGLSVLAWMKDVCTALPLVSGGCGRSETDAVVSDRTAEWLDLSVGDTLGLVDLAIEPVLPETGEPYPTAVRVTGIYRTGTPEQESWSGTQLFRTAPPRTLAGEEFPALLDAVFVPRLPLLEGLRARELTASARRAVQPGAWTAPELASVERTLRAWQQEVQFNDGAVVVTAPVLDLLGDVRADGEAARLAALLLGAQLIALSCCVLTLVVTGSADARAPDVALGRLRGLPRRSLVALGAAEPLVLVLVAAPVGVLLGALATAELAGVVLPGDVTLRADGTLAAALGVALAGSLVAVAAGARRVLARGVLGAADPAGGGTGRQVGDAVVTTVAALALWQVARDDTPDGTGLLAPVIGAVAVGLLLSRAGRLLSGPVVRRTASGSGIAAWLAARRTGRSDGSAGTVVLTAAALSCACYAAVVLVVTVDQRAAQADLEVGAATVYQVEPVEVDELVARVAAVDPSGQQLAAAVRSPAEDDEEALLAVDSSRFATVAAFREEWAAEPLSQLVGGLAPATSALVRVTGTQIAVDVDVRRAAGDGMVLGLRLVHGDGTPQDLALGLLAGGQNRLTAPLDCERGCRLQSATLFRGRAPQLVGEVVVRQVRVDGQPVDGLLDPADWRPTSRDRRDPLAVASTSLPGPDPQGLVVSFSQASAEQVGITRADVPEALPVLLAGDTPAAPAGRDGLLVVPVRSDALLLGRQQGRARLLPRLADAGYLVDLTLLQRAVPGELSGAVQEVWSAGPPDPGVVSALGQAGLQVVSTTTAAEREAALAQRGPARVLALLPVLAAVSLVLAALAQIAQALAVAGPRAVEAVGLQAVGVPRRALRRATAGEAAVLLALGTAAGTVAGVSTALLTAPAVGALGLTGPLAPFGETVPWVPVAGAAAVGAALLTVVAVGCSRAGLGRRDPQLLRQVTA